MQNTTPNLQNNLTDWLDYLHTIHISAIDMGLERVLPVFYALGIKKPNAYVFTVAGTNGKGSTTATIAGICQQAGYKVGLYQSPHLLSFNERVKINQAMASDTLLIQAFDKVEKARVACGLTLSFFEMTTLAAFWIFAEQNCDVWVLEVGLGGRLDVVNLIDPNLAVITNVGIDHVDWLGDTREKIGIEKAGILRKNMTLVYGETDMPSTILPIIAKHDVKLLQFGKDYFYQQTLQNHWQYSSEGVTLSLPQPNLSLHNTATAITAVLASELSIDMMHICQALPNIHLAGRFDKRQFLQRQWVFDVAHNEHGINFLLSQFLPFWQNYQQKQPDAKLYVIFSILADKDIDKILPKLATLPIEKLFGGEIDFFRAMPKADLQAQLANHIDDFVVYDDLAQATKQAIAGSKPHDVLLVCGSFHTIGDVLRSGFVK
ncbi:bifunctional folylpolyglutamate synthase/ dihydrofolate synthase [Moraxella macacae 0408225]|uniref:Dihydrofolate synthase/folylpolyglutamate synthase n=1 Tax=Moraxella macacae 0408225 TaxID=1230338 RepID=L2F9H6_9GAMM|nr:bifunctional tetrahydrofolate synthase/dihydrofolate synthase [Moraxella macacae]ELA09426.1 bifunctional folylpolyglutamate synthase/ dihydrofolate synthase [Moraxella macacae 0408225]